MDQSTREEKTYLTIPEKDKPEEGKEEAAINLLSMKAESLRDNFFISKAGTLVFLFFTACLLSTIPIGIILYLKIKISFQLYGWILLSLMGLVLILSLFTYIFRHSLTNKDTPGIYVYLMFIPYISALIGILTVFALYEIKVAIAIEIELITGLFLIFCLNKCFCLEKKFWINLMIVYSLVFVGIICYIAFFNRMFVEFFVITVYCSVSFAYLSSLSKFFYEEFYQDLNDLDSDPLSLRIHLTVMIASHVDLLVCSFKE